MLALDPPGNPTIGACIAANLSGPRRHRYGTARDLVHRRDGRARRTGRSRRSGGKVVKNVAGYDLGKLFCGSEGRLGLIARVALRLHPRPEVTRTLAVPARLAGGRGREGAGDPARAARPVGGRRALARPARGALRGLAARGRGAVRARAGARRRRRGLRLDVGGGRGAAGVGARAAALLAGPARGDARRARRGGRPRRRPASRTWRSEVEDPRDPAEVALAERVRAQFDPAGVLV